MKSVVIRKEDSQSAKRRYGSEVAVEELTGFSRRTLQRDRLLGRKRFPFYKVGRKILYDLTEVQEIIQRSRCVGGDVAEAR
jgi:hypothetical protein